MYKEVVETKAQFDWREERYPTNRRITIDIVSEVVAEEDIVRLRAFVVRFVQDLGKEDDGS